MSETKGRPELTPAEYLAERVDGQLRWYEDKSASAKRWYQRLQLVTVVLSASVPVLALSSGDVRVRILVALVGAATSIVAGLLALYRFGDLWADYRTAAEAIKCEKYRYLTGATPYVGAGAFSLFVNRIESIILEENRAWQEKGLRDDDASSEPMAGEGDDASAASSPPAPAAERHPDDDASAVSPSLAPAPAAGHRPSATASDERRS